MVIQPLLAPCEAERSALQTISHPAARFVRQSNVLRQMNFRQKDSVAKQGHDRFRWRHPNQHAHVVPIDRAREYRHVLALRYLS